MSESQVPIDAPLTNQQDALKVLVSALQIAQSRGTFKLEESARIAEAISLFQPKKVEAAPTAEDTKSTENESA